MAKNERLKVKRTEPAIQAMLSDLGGAAKFNLFYLVASSTPPSHPTSGVGTEPLINAVEAVSTIRPAHRLLSLGVHEPLSDADRTYIEERSRAAMTLKEILEDIPQLKRMKQENPFLRDMSLQDMMRRHLDVVRVLNYLNSSPDSFRTGLKRIGIEDPEEFLSNFLDEKDLQAAAFVDAAVGSWILRHVPPSDPTLYTLFERDDWSAHAITHSLEGIEVRGDIATNQGPVPSLETILSMHPKLRKYQLLLFRNMVQYNETVVLHTRKDQQNLAAIADYQDSDFPPIPQNQRAMIVVRSIMPPDEIDITPKEVDPADAAPFIKHAVAEGKIILASIGRLDFPKRDMQLLDNLEHLLTHLPAEQRDLLTKLRVAVVSRPKVFAKESEQKIEGLYAKNHDTFEEGLARINALYRSITGLDEDFILVNRDPSENLQGMSPIELRENVFPFVDIAVGLGEEGLNLTVQEIGIHRTFGRHVPQPTMTILSPDAGFSEKALDHDIASVLVLNSPYNPEEFLGKLIEAVNKAEAIRENPSSKHVADIVTAMRYYYEEVCKDGFHEEVLADMIRVRNFALARRRYIY